MAENLSLELRNELEGIKFLLWGANIIPDVFKRWSQGFNFSSYEPSALEQNDGGPCAVIAPVQAFILKSVVHQIQEAMLSTITVDKQNYLLVTALCDILAQCNGTQFNIVYLNRTPKCSPQPAEDGDELRQESEQSSSAMTLETESSEGNLAAFENVNSTITFDELTSAMQAENFHSNLRVTSFESLSELEKYYRENISSLKSEFGVLLFLYSVILTKGLELVKHELSDMSEPLIHETYGYGSQALINLMLTGRAVAHVFDNVQDAGGLQLHGLDKQSEIGFITLMEYMRLCTVGSFYKNPRNPVWVMGSDTHLTVLFTFDKRLASPETPYETAKRVFKSYDPEDKNFIASLLLQDVLQILGLVSEPEYVEIMKKKLDPDNFQIIMLNDFMDEFFPNDKPTPPDTFTLWHYNGLARSNTDNKVMYNKGQSILLECGDVKSVSSDSMLTCLQTKWPNIEVSWTADRVPSLN